MVICMITFLMVIFLLCRVKENILWKIKKKNTSFRFHKTLAKNNWTYCHLHHVHSHIHGDACTCTCAHIHTHIYLSKNCHVDPGQGYPLGFPSIPLTGSTANRTIQKWSHLQSFVNYQNCINMQSWQNTHFGFPKRNMWVHICMPSIWIPLFH